MHKRHEKYIEIAYQQSFTSNSPRYFHGAIIVVNNKIYIAAANKLTSKSLYTKEKRAIHAEVNACLKAMKKGLQDFSSATMYVIRRRKGDEEGTISLSKPCEECTKFLNKIGIKKVYYSINNY